MVRILKKGILFLFLITLNYMNAQNGKIKNPYYSHTATNKLKLTDKEWKNILPENLYLVSRKADTEASFTGKYWNYTGKGTYYCAACGNTLFRSDAKFASSCGCYLAFLNKLTKRVLFLEVINHMEWIG